MDGPYADHILDASDVCNGCLRVVRQERIDPTRDGLTREYEDSLERDPQTTEIGYGPADSVSEQKGVFCAHCGTESPHERWWDEGDVNAALFHDLVDNLVATLEHKEVTVDAVELRTYARGLHKNADAGVDEALAQGLAHGLRIAAARASSAEPAV